MWVEFVVGSRPCSKRFFSGSSVACSAGVFRERIRMHFDRAPSWILTRERPLPPLAFPRFQASLCPGALIQHGGESTRSRTINTTRAHGKRLHCRLGPPVFPSPQKPTFLNSNSIQNPRATGLSVPDCCVSPSLNKVDLFTYFMKTRWFASRSLLNQIIISAA